MKMFKKNNCANNIKVQSKRNIPAPWKAEGN